jgi:hypothetical protein
MLCLELLEKTVLAVIKYQHLELALGLKLELPLDDEA